MSTGNNNFSHNLAILLSKRVDYTTNYFLSTLVCLEMFNKIATAKKTASSELPPYEINGRGTPVNGRRETIPARFTKTCKPSQIPKPEASNWPKRSGA